LNVPSCDGYGFERLFSGVSFIDVPAIFRRQRKIKLDDAVRYVIRCQNKFGWDPRRPRTKLARAIYDRVSRKLKLLGNKEELLLCICVGTCLDCMGIDCFLKCGRKIVTIDLTISPKGKISPRADVVITRQHFLDDKYYQIGDEIAVMLHAI